MMWGYARVSTADQTPDAQIDTLRQAGVDAAHLVVEHASGAKVDRPGLDGLLKQVAAGDVLVVWKLDRLGRSLPHLVQVVNQLGERGARWCKSRNAIRIWELRNPTGTDVYCRTTGRA